MANGLRRLDGVADVLIDLQQNVCEVTPEPGRAPDFAGLPAALRSAGYRPGRIWLRARGTADGSGRFRIAGFDRDLPLHGEAPAEGMLTALVELQPVVSLRVAAPPIGDSVRAR